MKVNEIIDFDEMSRISDEQNKKAKEKEKKEKEETKEQAKQAKQTKQAKKKEMKQANKVEEVLMIDGVVSTAKSGATSSVETPDLEIRSASPKPAEIIVDPQLEAAIAADVASTGVNVEQIGLSQMEAAFYNASKKAKRNASRNRR